MKKHFVIANLPAKLPVTSTAFWTFIMYYFKAPGWGWGVFITVFAIFWIIAIAVKSCEVSVDLLGENLAPEKQVKRSRFQEKLAELVKQAEDQKNAKKS